MVKASALEIFALSKRNLHGQLILPSRVTPEDVRKMRERGMLSFGVSSLYFRLRQVFQPPPHCCAGGKVSEMRRTQKRQGMLVTYLQMNVPFPPLSKIGFSG